jgi:hypothetical protein
MEWGLSLYTTEEDVEAGKRGGISIIAMDEVRLCRGGLIRRREEGGGAQLPSLLPLALGVF